MHTPLLRGLAALTLAALLAACGGGRTDDPAPATPSAAAEPETRERALAYTGPTQRLTVTAPTGGRVISMPAGLDCGSTCAADFPQGSVVSLRAVPASNFVFNGWSGSCSDPTACSVTMSTARTVTASFASLNPLAQCTVTRSTGTTAQISSTHPRILLANSELKTCLQRQITHAAPAALRMKSYVDAQMVSNNIYGFEPWTAALVYQATGDLRYADYAVQRTDAFVAAEEALIASGQRPTVAYDSYLEVGEKIGGLATVYDWAWDRLTPQQRARWIAYANQAVWNVWNPSQAQWGGRPFTWTGWSIDNPANNYYYSFLRATMLLGLATHGENAQAPTWITRFRTDKIQNQLLPMFNSQLQGGGSREGTGYGTAMRGLWELYDWWERSTGERIASLTPHTRDSIAHLLHNLVPTLDRLAPTGDHARDSTAALFDYHRQYLLTLMSLYPQDRLSAIARSALELSSVPRTRYSYDYYSDFMYAPPIMPAASLSELSTAYWGPGTGQLMMRSGWDPAATYSNFICGPYTESHAHRDQGSFVLFKGDWLAWDSNIRSTSGIEQGEEKHNLVRMVKADNSVITQRAETSPCRLLALAHNDLFTYAVADVTPVYGGSQSSANGVSRIEREYLFIRPSTVVVMDRVVTTNAGTRKLWTLNLPGQPTLSAGRMQLAVGQNQLDVYGLAPAGATGVWTAGQRVEVADSATGQSTFLHVLGANGSVASAVRDDISGQTGTRVTLADGRSLLVRFNTTTGTGGTTELRSTTGALLFGGALPNTVQPPALYAGDLPPPPPPPTPVTVSLTSPGNGTSYVAPASFNVTASATPIDQVLRVELWRNGAKVAEDTSSPYAFAQSALPAGSYQYEARAVRTDGGTSVSTAIGITVTAPAPTPATVALTSPSSGSQVAFGLPVTLSAAVQGQVTTTRVDFVANGNVVASRTASPWSQSWTPPTAGTWTLQARATLSDGRVLNSATSTLTVVAPTAIGTVSVALTSPTAGAQYTLGTALTFAATVQGSTAIARIEFLANNSVVGSRTATPWSLSWTPPTAGSWTLMARATLSDGRVLTSRDVVVGVVAPQPPPGPGTVMFRQGNSGYSGAVDNGVSDQYAQYNSGRGTVTNDPVSGVYRISGTSGYEARSFVRFAGLESLAGRRVTRAELVLTFNFGATGYNLSGRYLAKAWTPSSSSFGWTRRDSSNAWAVGGSGGTDWVADKTFTVTGFTGAQADVRTVAIDAAVVQGWIDAPTGNHGLVLVPTVAGKVSWLRTSEDPTATYRPTLKVWLE
ncbi:MAG: Ig-like domain-containing protein [Aquabacterium sp.]